MFTYLFIFLAKVFENSMATLRLILVSNGKKLLGAILNFIISIAWIISAGLAISNIKEDPFKIIVFALGCFVGSFIGSLIEEKIAIGSNMLYVITKKENTKKIKDILNKSKYVNYAINSDDNNIILIMVNRKKRKEVLNLIRTIDEKSIIISEVARQLIFK